MNADNYHSDPTFYDKNPRAAVTQESVTAALADKEQAIQHTEFLKKLNRLMLEIGNIPNKSIGAGL